MGNVPSDSLNHSFKRFRTSETHEISHTSPVSISPKRKITQNNMSAMDDGFNESISSSADGTPVILCDHFDQFSLTASANLNSFTIDTNDQFMKSSQNFNNNSSNSEPATRITCNTSQNVCVCDDAELSDQEIIACLRSKKSSMSLSDGDVLQCLAQTQACSIRDCSTSKTSLI